jgi:hypothetical protein
MRSPGEDTHARVDGGWVLPEPAPREAVHTRSIVCRSFRRLDGLVDIDGRFIDTRSFAYDNHFRGHCDAGDALHNMQLRLTLNSARQIEAVQSAMPSTPYTICPQVNANFQRLVGLSMARGFRKAMRERIGGVEGCTHVVALLDAMAAAAVQTFASSNRAPRADGTLPAKTVQVFSLDALIGSCHSYHPDSPVVAQMRALHGED